MTAAEIHPFSAQPDEPDERTETRPETSVIFRPQSSAFIEKLNHGGFVNVDEGAVEFSFDREAWAAFIKLQ